MITSNVKQNQIKKQSMDSSILDDLMEADVSGGAEQSQIEAIARSVPTLYHVRCAFCAYECLLFRTSLWNTLYKSPFDEHREKFGSVCPIFALHHDMATSSKNTVIALNKSGVDLHRNLTLDSSKCNNLTCS